MKNQTFHRMVASIAAVTLVGGLGAASVSAVAAPSPLTNLAHLDFLLDEASPAEIEGHTTYRLAEEPALTMPWTYADARAGGTFERVGGGPLDPETGHWGQGAYNADDITRASVVYLRHWQQTGSESSRESAYELLRSVAYFQTVTGLYAGNVVLWMQPDGSFNPSPVPVELPDPSDSGDSYWLARTIWALGEGYAAFSSEDPEFAAFLQDRLQLGVSALEREALNKYGEYDIADGVQVPAWLIANGADASAEAVLGLSAYVGAAPDDAPARTALAQLAEGIAALGAGDTKTWPYGALLPWTESRSLWHAWGSQMPASLAAASVALGEEELLAPAVADSVGFTTTLLTAGGPDNGWLPTPIDRVQIAYGVDSRVQSLIAVADAADRPGLAELAGMMASWYFGTNKAAEPIYDSATGITFDGVQPDGTINRNSGAESTIHGLLSMLLLDANPEVAERAQAVTTVAAIDGLTVVEAEAAESTTGSVVTPASAWTGESQFGGGAYLELTSGEKAVFNLGKAEARNVEPVTLQPNPGEARSVWHAGKRSIGSLEHSVGAQGITAASGALLPQPLQVPLAKSQQSVTVTGVSGTVQLDSLIVRPLVSRLTLEGASSSTELVHSTSLTPVKAKVGSPGERAVLRSYDGDGVLVDERAIKGPTKVTLRPGGFAVISR